MPKKASSPKIQLPLVIEATQEEMRAMALGGFMPRTVADKAIAIIERTYEATASRERIAKLGGAF